ncbi:uncharacterized protein EI90DRAFT_3074328 [Cantharellus anzutake]|uniref:uncharacterized protein n=1 Tax=Cantharellus anzutake TaxID=1750568 RepID=UPI001904DE4A|nr:uncharacterized protein EI90DRAFT_3074328 [Cantharellus anzutake]KAF8324897.1 hypothetical protein EI90DRAFT_3074328 [Cantharellus anzutake]
MASQKVHGQVLQPGSACLTCRQRKTKCDGVRPICGRCARLGKQCAFENETRKPRTERLLDKIALLESKIAAYDPQNAHLSYNGDGGMTSQASSSRNVADDHASMGHPPSEGYLVQESALSAMSSTHSSSSSSPSTGRPMELLPIYPQSSFAMLHGGGVDGGDLNIVHTSSVAYNAVISCEVLEHSLHQWNGQGDVPEFLCDYL